MMNKIQQGVLILLRSAITGVAATLPDGFSIEAAEKLIMEHQIAGMAYEGAVLCGISKKTPAMQRLFQKYYRQIVHNERQMTALDKLFEAFDENGIDYLTVKGADMKKMYPNPAMRIMGDADVLIRMEQYEKIKPLMIKLGYTEGHEIDHEWVWDSDSLHLELHKRLIPSTNTDYYNYFGDGWDHAKPLSGSRYKLSNEMAFVFLLLHFAKHYRGGGIGLRQTIDLWVYQENTPMDEAVLRDELAKANLLEFYQNIKNLLDSWFAGREVDDKTAFISEFLFCSGSWGTMENKIIGQGLKSSKSHGTVEKARQKMVCEAVFPPLKTMKKRYKVLEKAPVLLPVYWPIRWADALLFRHENIQNYSRNLELASAENIDSFEKSLNYVGLSVDL